MKKFKSPLGLTAVGSGPKIVRRTLPFVFLSIVAGIFFPETLKFPGLDSNILLAPGWILLIFGLFIWLIAVAQFAISFPKGKLVTNGVFALSRNPIYSSYSLLILPGISLVCNNWGFLVSAIVMYILTAVLVKEEEKQLQELFESEFTAYCEKTNRIIFFPKFLFKV